SKYTRPRKKLLRRPASRRSPMVSPGKPSRKRTKQKAAISLCRRRLMPCYERELPQANRSKMACRAGARLALPGGKQPADVKDDGAERAGRQAGADQSEHER